jgi:serine/threonine-protein kinase RsbW
MQAPSEFGVDTSQMQELVVPNTLSGAKLPEDRIMAELARCGYEPDTVFAIKLALEEAMTNAVKHGNKLDSCKCVTVRYDVTPQRVVIMVRDQGCGFRPEEVPDPTAEENLERPNGRGIMLMQSYMTRVQYNEAGNEVWLLKEREAQA